MNSPKLIHIILIFLLFTIFYCESISANLDMQVFPAYDNYHKQSKWLPLYIVLTNTTGEFDGEIAVEIQSDNNNSRIYSTQVSLFGNTKKTKYLYIHPENIQSIANVKLKDKQDKSIIERNLRLDIISPKDKLVAFIKQDGDAQIPFNGTNSRLYFSTISPEKLPDEWKGYDPLDAIVWGNISTNLLSDKQEKALINWLYSGGTLIVSGGINAQSLRGTFIEKLLPVEIAETRITNSIQSLGILKSTMVVSSSRLKGDGKIILAEDDGMPVIAEKNIGSGKCIFLCFDYSDPAIKTWSGNSKLWDTIITKSEKSEDVNYGNISRIIANQRHLSLPSYKLIGGFALLYILSLAISGYIIIKSRKKELVWLFTFLIIVVFVLSSLGFSYTMNRKSLIITDFSIADVYQDTKSAKITSYFSPLSFMKSKLEMSFPNAVFVGEPISKDTELFWKGSFRLNQDSAFQLNISDMGFMPSNFLYGETIANFDGNIYVDIIDSKRLGISNKTKFGFADCLLIINGGYAQIKSFAADSKTNIELMDNNSDDIFYNYNLEDGSRKQFFNAIKSSLYGRISDKALIGWFDGSALETIAEMSLNKSYKSLGMALVIINL